MDHASGWLIAALLLYVLIRRPYWILFGSVSALVYWDFGSEGLAVLWAVFLAIDVHSRRSRHN